jgi:hypothetical protein
MQVGLEPAGPGAMQGSRLHGDASPSIWSSFRICKGIVLDRTSRPMDSRLVVTVVTEDAAGHIARCWHETAAGVSAHMRDLCSKEPALPDNVR